MRSRGKPGMTELESLYIMMVSHKEMKQGQQTLMIYITILFRTHVK